MATRAQVFAETAPLMLRIIERHRAKSAGEGDRTAHGSPSPRNAEDAA